MSKFIESELLRDVMAIALKSDSYGQFDLLTVFGYMKNVDKSCDDSVVITANDKKVLSIMDKKTGQWRIGLSFPKGTPQEITVEAFTHKGHYQKLSINVTKIENK